jgi:hypothetical protein
MLIKCDDIFLGESRDSSTSRQTFEQARYEIHVNPDHIALLEISPNGLQGYARLHVGNRRAVISIADAQRIIAMSNGTPDAGQSAAGDMPGVIQADRYAHIEQMTLDSFYSKTAQAARRMWRCTTEEGYSFNIFDHVDHRNTYTLFRDYHMWMDDMTDGQVLDWSETPIPVYLQRNGDFYNPVKVELPDHEMRPILVMEDDPNPESDDA